MKISVLLLVLLITWCLVDESSGSWRRRGRRWRVRVRVRVPVRVNVNVRIGKRETKNIDIVTKPLPCDFSVWDKNSDSVIDEEEFVDLVKLQRSGKDVRYAFEAADVDGDGNISPVELPKAPLIFEKC